MISIKNPKTGVFEMVPCGHCIGCLHDMQSEWMTRLWIEYKSDLSRPAVFVTLTYNEENLPSEEFNSEGVVYEKPSVVKSHVQQFMRSLRTNIKRQIDKNKWKGWKGAIKYFFTSEYGPNGGRPHYHGIIYGLTRQDEELIEQIWNKGFVNVGDVNEKTITYVTKYCLKPTEFSAYPDRKGYFDNEKWMDEQGIRRKPFRLMSTGLGSAYFEDRQNLKFHFKDIIKHNYIRVNNIKKKMPRYFKKKIYTDANGEKYCKNYKRQMAKIISQIHKKDKEYDKPYYYYNIDNAIGRMQYYRHLIDTIEKQQNDENYLTRSDKSAIQREDTLIQSRRKWFRREGRYHKGAVEDNLVRV